MRPAISACLALVALSLSACDKGSEPSTSPDPSPEPAVEASETPDAGSELTGLIDEESFKALHELTAEQAPAPRGELLELAGTEAYLSLPEDGTPPIAGVVVIHEWWGLNDHIRHWTDRLAEDGYAALAVDLYGGKVATTPEEAMILMKAVDKDTAAAILSAAHDYLQMAPTIKADRQASIGWCYGGGWSLRHAIATPDLDAAVIYYGHPELDLAALGQIEAPMMGVFANEDQSITPEVVDAFDKALGEAGKSIELHRYDANHAFANPSSANYNQEAASDAWAKVRAFLAAKLRPEGEAEPEPAPAD